MATKPPPPPPRSATPPPAAASSSTPLAFKKIAAGVGNVRVVLNCAEGWGKTTLLAHAPKPLIVMSPQESGFTTLRQADRVPDVPCVQPSTWPELLDLVRSDSLDAFETIGFDALGGIEQMCINHVLERDFNGDKTKYQAFGRGNATMASEWMVLLSALETLSRTHDIVIASHVEIANFSNPDGDNYGRFVSDANKHVWAATKRWADAVLFGTFYTAVEDGKGHGGTERVLYTEHRATHDAKNRFGMPSMVQIPAKSEDVYRTVFNLIKKGND